MTGAGREPPGAANGDDAKYRDWLVQADHDASRDYDRTILTLATGALALSVTFAHDIAPHPTRCSTSLLATAWVLLTLSLITILVSLITSQAALRQTIEDLDSGRDVSDRPGGAPARWTEYLNVVSGVLLVLGMIAFAVFAYVNL